MATWLKVVGVFAFCATISLADSKTEAELRQRLAASEAARTALVDSLAKITAAQSQQSAVSTRRNAAAEAQRSDQLSDAKRAAERANVNALMQREDARTQTDQLLRASDSAKWGTYATLGVTSLGFLSLIFTSFWQGHTAKRDHRWAMEKIGEVKIATDSVVAISKHTEENTNHLKDELVALTAKASHAEGVIEGKRESPAQK